MKGINRQPQIVTMARPCSVSKEYLPVQSPDRQMLYGMKTQSQARIQTYVGSPNYIQSPLYEANKQVLTSPNLSNQPQSPKKLLDSYHYKQKTLDLKTIQQEQHKIGEYKPYETSKQLFSQTNTYQIETQKMDFAKTYQENLKFEINKENRDQNIFQQTEKRENQYKEFNTIQDSKENIKIGQEFLSRSPLHEFATSNISTQSNKVLQFTQVNTSNSRLGSQNFSQLTSKSKLQYEINRISSNLRDLLQQVQKVFGQNSLPDQLNDKMIDILSNFRKVEELATQEPQISLQNNSTNQIDNEYKIQVLTEDYNKLKGILEQLQTKMGSLVQENQKLNKNMIEQEQRVAEEQLRVKDADEKAIIAQKEFNRVLECLQFNQKENEELRKKLQNKEYQQQNDDFICRQLFQQEDINKKYTNLQKEYEMLEQKYKLIVQERNNLQNKDLSKSPSILRSASSKAQKQNEQAEFKLLQLQIENDNLKANIAHNQVDSKQIDQKNTIIGQLEDKIKISLREKSDLEEQLHQITYQFENQLDQLKSKLELKENDYQQIIKQKKDIEKDFQSSIQNFQIVQKGLDDKLLSAKKDYDKILAELKSTEQKKNKLSDEIKLQEKTIEQLKNEQGQYNNENKKLQEKCQQQQKQLDHYNQQIQQFQLTQQQLIQQLDHFKQQEYQLIQQLEKNEILLKQQQQDAYIKINELNDTLNKQNLIISEKENKINDIIEEMSALKDQYEVQKKIFSDNQNDLERKFRNQKSQFEEILEVKENEINELKLNMDQQIKLLDKRNALSNVDYLQREEQLQLDIQQKCEIIEQLKLEIEKNRTINYNLQEETLKQNLQTNQFQSIINGLKNELLQQKQELQHMSDMLKKRKEESEQLQQTLEEARKENVTKKTIADDTRRSMMKQQDLQITIESLQRENISLAQKNSSITNELNRKQREFSEKAEEYSILKRKYDEALSNFDRLEKRWMEKIDQRRNI